MSAWFAKLKSGRWYQRLRSAWGDLHQDYRLSGPARQWPLFLRLRSPFGMTKKRKVFISLMFSLLSRIARADSQIDEDERAILQDYMIHELRLPGEERLLAYRILRDSAYSQYTFEQYAQNFFDHFQGTPALLENAIFLMLGVAGVDGSRETPELKLISKAAAIFGIERSTLNEIIAEYWKIAEERAAFFQRKQRTKAQKHYEEYRQYARNQRTSDRARGGSSRAQSRSAYAGVGGFSGTDELSRARKLLGVSSTDPWETVRSKYRALVKKYHPDRLRCKGVPEEMLEYSASKFREVQEAYELLENERWS